MLAASGDSCVAEAMTRARQARLPAGTTVFRPGNPCTDYLLVLDGRVRVEITGETGRQIVLYRVHPGEGCVLTTSCLLSADHYPATGVVETDMSALLLPRTAFEDALSRSSDFRRFVFHELGSRLAQVLARIEAVALQPFEHRLARALLALAGDDARVHGTHQALAAELGTAREVVSRGLARFAARGWIRSGRGWIELLDREAMRTAAG
jgi:CRP/FNR family transcriptional regulator